ncbi:MAG: hypothetical protein LBM73_00135, partial [Candidatus Nomurabacteria bacterium]|jgi:hypothetical protein|nr:hypothetical protein [Candidatus Nomurabacteria bacterium]
MKTEQPPGRRGRIVRWATPQQAMRRFKIFSFALIGGGLVALALWILITHIFNVGLTTAGLIGIFLGMIIAAGIVVALLGLIYRLIYKTVLRRSKR